MCKYSGSFADDLHKETKRWLRNCLVSQTYTVNRGRLAYRSLPQKVTVLTFNSTPAVITVSVAQSGNSEEALRERCQVLPSVLPAHTVGLADTRVCGRDA